MVLSTVKKQWLTVRQLVLRLVEHVPFAQSTVLEETPTGLEWTTSPTLHRKAGIDS